MSQQLSPLEQFLSNKLANELRYAGGQIGKGNIPYIGKPRFTPDQLRSLTAPGLISPSFSSVPPRNTNIVNQTAAQENVASILDAPAAPVLPPPSNFTNTAAAPGGSAAARAEQQERSRIAQMTEQDPLFKKYKVADLTKAYNTATDPKEKERIGLEIWATSNPQLAAKLKPGQSGYQQAAAVLGTQIPGTNQPGITQAEISQLAEKVGAPAMVEVPQGISADYTTPTASFGTGINAQQLAYSPTAEAPLTTIGAEVFTQQGPFNVPKELLDQKTRSLLRQAFASRIK